MSQAAGVGGALPLFWQPRATCDRACLPAPGAQPEVSGVRQAGRLIALLGVMLAGVMLVGVLPLLSLDLRLAAGRLWARAVLAALGVRVVPRGRFPRRRALLVANHISWLDALALLAVAPARMLGKSDIRDWPVIGALAAAGGTVFVDRSRPRALPGTIARIADALRADGVVAAFPEGTSWCGTMSGRFRPAVFQAAIDAKAVVVPARLAYRLGATGEATAVAAFLGDETLWASMRRVLAVRGLVIAVSAGAALHPEPSATRRALARAAEASVRPAPPGLVTPSVPADLPPIPPSWPAVIRLVDLSRHPRRVGSGGRSPAARRRARASR